MTVAIFHMKSLGLSLQHLPIEEQIGGLPENREIWSIQPSKFELNRTEKYFKSSNKGYTIPSEKFSLKVDNAIINCW